MSAHVVPLRTYTAIFLALLAGTALTVFAAFQDLGRLNTPIAITIAVIKALLVILYFMHLRWSSRLTWLFAGAGFFWLLLLIGLTMADFDTRAWT